MSRTMRNLSWLIVALMAAVSTAGLALRESLYRDEAWILNADRKSVV